MAKTDIITITNIEEDSKELGIVNGKRIVLGSKLDAGIVSPNIARPRIEISRENYESMIKASPALEQSMDYWTKHHKVFVEGI